MIPNRDFLGLLPRLARRSVRALQLGRAIIFRSNPVVDNAPVAVARGGAPGLLPLLHRNGEHRNERGAGILRRLLRCLLRRLHVTTGDAPTAAPPFRNRERRRAEAREFRARRRRRDHIRHVRVALETLAIRAVVGVVVRFFVVGGGARVHGPPVILKAWGHAYDGDGPFVDVRGVCRIVENVTELFVRHARAVEREVLGREDDDALARRHDRIRPHARLLDHGCAFNEDYAKLAGRQIDLAHAQPSAYDGDDLARLFRRIRELFREIFARLVRVIEHIAVLVG